MKKKSLLFTIAIGMTYLAISSHSAGPGATGNNRTGAGGSTPNCAGSGCHSANTTSTIVNFILNDTLTGTNINVSGGKYVPGRSYKVTINGFNTASSSRHFGFQAAVTDKASINTGTLLIYDTANTVIRTSPVLVEHKKVITAGSASTMNGVFYWKAPVKGTGSVRFYGTFMVVDSNNATSNDLANNAFRDVDEDLTASINEISASIATSIYPNPCSNVLHIETKANTTFEAQIFGLGGKKILSSKESTIDVSSLNPGFYFLNMSNENGVQTIPFVKQ